jgi:hypothetical protein
MGRRQRSRRRRASLAASGTPGCLGQLAEGPAAADVLGLAVQLPQFGTARPSRTWTSGMVPVLGAVDRHLIDRTPTAAGHAQPLNSAAEDGLDKARLTSWRAARRVKQLAARGLDALLTTSGSPSGHRCYGWPRVPSAAASGESRANPRSQTAAIAGAVRAAFPLVDDHSGDRYRYPVSRALRHRASWSGRSRVEMTTVISTRRFLSAVTSQLQSHTSSGSKPYPPRPPQVAELALLLTVPSRGASRWRGTREIDDAASNANGFNARGFRHQSF